MITAARCAVVMPLMDERGILWKDSSDLLLLFPDKFVYFYVFSLGLLLANQDTELTQIHSGRKAASRISRGVAGHYVSWFERDFRKPTRNLLWFANNIPTVGFGH